MEETERLLESFSDTSSACAASSSDADTHRLAPDSTEKISKLKRLPNLDDALRRCRRLHERKSGRSSSGENVSERARSKQTKRRASKKTSDNTEPKGKKGDGTTKVKRRRKNHGTAEGKGENKTDKRENKIDTKGSERKSQCPIKSALRRPNSSLADPIIRVKVTPSNSNQTTLHRVADDRGKAHSSTMGEDRAKAHDSALRRPRRRKTKAKKEVESAVSDGAVVKTAAPTPPPAPATMTSASAPAAAAPPTQTAPLPRPSLVSPVPRATPAARASTLSPVGPTSPLGMVALRANSHVRTSPLHCAFLNALKECSPRLIAALSATNEAAFLNAMWSCFWRGYRAGFQASVRVLEANSNSSLASNTTTCALSALLDAAPRAALSEKRRSALKAAADAGTGQKQSGTSIGSCKAHH